MSQRIPIFIPTFISDQNYNPNRVLPRIYFFNGMLECEQYYIESGSLTTAGSTKETTQFPYFDHYNVVSGSFPTSGSDSLLFNNENPIYGQQPTETLFTTYWSTYVELLYNPKTRLIGASAIIPLSEYFDTELNDIVNFKGNYYHLRAINDYNLKTGECKIQLLGPIISDTFGISSADIVTTTTTTTTTAAPTTTTTTIAPTTTTTTQAGIRLDWNFIESGGARGEMELYINSNQVENRFINSSGTYYVNVGDTIDCVVYCDECAQKANAYSLFLISDGTCADASTTYTSPVYTVQSGDANLVLSMYATCDTGCV
jgi:hypothetical protein